MTFKLESTSFSANAALPDKYTCDGDNISPELHWQESPVDTKSYVLIMDDPDAPKGTFDHWLLFNLPKEVHQLSENYKPSHDVQSGKNSWGKFNYGGPCPPDGEHRYYFKLYALDTTLNLSAPNKAQLEKAMQNHVLATAVLMCKYMRKK